MSYEEAAAQLLRTVGPQFPDDVVPTRSRPGTQGDGLLKATAKGALHLLTHPGATLRSAARGAVNAVDDTAETLIELAATALPSTRKRSREIAQDATAFIDKANDSMFGPRSGAASEQLVEDTAQFLTGFFGAGKLKVAGRALSSLGPVTSGLARGAIADFAAFDPHKEQLAELAASSSIPGIHDLGVLLSVEGDDGPVASRTKRALGGLLPGAAVDGLIASARLLRSAKTLKEGTAAPEVLSAARQTAEESTKTLEAIEAGTHVPDAPAVVKQKAPGEWTVVPREPRTSNIPDTRPPTDDIRVAHPASAGLADEVERGGGKVAPSGVPAAEAGVPEFLEASSEQFQRSERRQLDRRVAAPGSPLPDGIELDRRLGDRRAPELTFTSRWEAEGQAASINEALAARAAARAKVTPDQMESVFALAKEITEAGNDPEKLLDAFGKVRFNFGYLDTPGRSEAVLRAASEILNPVFEGAQGRPAVSLTESVDRAAQIAGMLTRDDAPEYLENAGNVLKNADANILLMNAQLSERGEQVAKWSAILDQRPGDLVAYEEARRALQTYINFAADVTGANSGLGRGLNALKARGDEGLVDLKFKGEAGAASMPEPKAGDVPDVIAGLTTAELRNVTRLFRMSKEPKVLFNTLASELKPNLTNSQRVGRGFMEFFYNSVLSGPATHAAIFAGNGVVSLLEDGVRLLAGTVTRNDELVAEATDLLAGRLLYGQQSIKGMALAYRAGHSIIDPKPIYKAIPGVAGEVIRTLGSRPMAAMDEFWRVNNNLAFIRMNSLKIARREAAARGLQGTELDRFLSDRVQADVAASLDPTTGASRLPAAREFAALPTFSSPLNSGSFGASLEELVERHPILTPVLPFVRTSVNVFDYSFRRGSPLGLFSDGMRKAITSGTPEGAVMATRMTVGTTIWGTAGLMAFGGGITGAGPSDPRLRKLWLANNQPYSIRVGDTWVSYRRAEPFATPLSFAADLAHILRDTSADMEIDGEGSAIFYGLVAATVSATTNKTYLNGLVDFMDAIGSGQPHKVKRFIDGLVSTAVPNVVQVFNNDPYLRETKGLLDVLRNRVPGWSEVLPARYNVFGEPITLSPSRAHRSLNPLPFREAGATTEADMLELGRAFMVPPTIERFGQLSVNLHDRRYQNTTGNTATPYERWMELISDQGLRKQVDEVIASDAYKRAGDGTEVFAGGRKFRLLERRIDRVYEQTRRKMLSEYPDLAQELKALDRARRASGRSDERAASILEQLR